MTSCQMEFCKQCHQSLANLGEIPLHYYVRLCSYYLAGFPVVAKGGPSGKGDTLIHLLETVGYIVTTEIEEECLRIIPIGYEKVDESTHKFSACRGAHAED